MATPPQIIDQTVQSLGLPSSADYIFQDEAYLESRDRPNQLSLTGKPDLGVGLFQLDMFGGQGQGYSQPYLLNPYNNARIGIGDQISAYRVGVDQGLTGTNLLDYTANNAGHPNNLGTQSPAARRYDRKLNRFYRMLNPGAGLRRPTNNAGLPGMNPDGLVLNPEGLYPKSVDNIFTSGNLTKVLHDHVLKADTMSPLANQVGWLQNRLTFAPGNSGSVMSSFFRWIGNDSDPGVVYHAVTGGEIFHPSPRAHKISNAQVLLTRSVIFIIGMVIILVVLMRAIGSMSHESASIAVGESPYSQLLGVR